MPALRDIPIPIQDGLSVSGLFHSPPSAWICVALAHGAGAGMRHPFMAGMAAGLADRGVATLRYQFPYMEQGLKRVDSPAIAHATVRAAVRVARELCPNLPLLAGGKSFGGRMTSQAQAISPLKGVLGLVFFGFPLHPAGRPSTARAEHLDRVLVPLLFLQGTRDALADRDLMTGVTRGLGTRSTLVFQPDADHSFHVPARTGRSDAHVRSEMLDALVAWAQELNQALT